MEQIIPAPIDETEELNIIPIPNHYLSRNHSNDPDFPSYITGYRGNTTSDIFELSANVDDYFIFMEYNDNDFNHNEKYAFLDASITKYIDTQFSQIDPNIKTDKILIITRNQLITPQLIKIMKQYCGIIFLDYNHQICNLPPNIKYLEVLGKHEHDFNNLHTGLLFLEINMLGNNSYNDCNCNSSFDNLPYTTMILRFRNCNLIKKINQFPSSLIYFEVDDYNNDLDNLPDGLRYCTIYGNCGTLSNIPPNLNSFRFLGEQSFNIMEPFSEELKFFCYNGEMESKHFNMLPDSVIKIVINSDLLDDIKYPKSLKILYALEYGLLNFDIIPEGVEIFQVCEAFLGLIKPELLPKSLKKVLIQYDADFHDNWMYKRDSESESENENESENESENENSKQPRKRSRYQSKKELLFEYLTAKGISIVDTW